MAPCNGIVHLYLLVLVGCSQVPQSHAVSFATSMAGPAPCPVAVRKGKSWQGGREKEKESISRGPQTRARRVVAAAGQGQGKSKQLQAHPIDPYCRATYEYEHASTINQVLRTYLAI